MRYDPPECCPPDRHPPLPDIAAGQATLNRQLLGFPEWRRAMLAEIREHPSLTHWRADSAGDLGVMLLEAWAYVLDVTAFYDARIAERAYLGTAHDEKIAAQIAALIGFVPRPALSAMVDLALEARGADPVSVPQRTAFRSEAFGEEPPQVFETVAANTIWPQRNRWQLAAYYEPGLTGETLRFQAAEGPSRGAILAIANGSDPIFAGRVRRVRTEAASDGQRYQQVDFDGTGTPPSVLTGKVLDNLHVEQVGFRIGLSMLVAEAARIDVADQSMVLDGLYPQLAAGQLAVVETAGSLHPVEISAATLYLHPLETGFEDATPKIPLTQVQFTSPSAVTFGATGMFLHCNGRLLGRPAQPAENTISLADIAGGIDLEKPMRPLLDASASGTTIAVGERARGAKLPGTVTVLEDGSGEFLPDGTTAPFPEELAAPVKLFGNIVTALRGETVLEELLGSGDASAPFQHFALKKKPLSWIEDDIAMRGRRPRLEVAVDGLYWIWVETLYGRGPDERVFTITMDPDGTAHIEFGDGETGSRLPTGSGNVSASYVFGAGAAKPPPGSIKQLVRPPKDVMQVRSPLAPYGGADAHDTREIAELAPGSTLVLDRAVSAADYLTMARAFSGIVNAAVSQRWDGTAQRSVIEIAYIADAGDPSATLRDFLYLRSAPGVEVSVAAATKVDLSPFEIALQIDPAFVPQLVRDAVTDALLDPADGLLAPAQIPIGAPLFRSQILRAAHAVPGVEAVTAIRFGSREMAYAEAPGAGAWFDLLANGRVS